MLTKNFHFEDPALRVGRTEPKIENSAVNIFSTASFSESKSPIADPYLTPTAATNGTFRKRKLESGDTAIDGGNDDSCRKLKFENFKQPSSYNGLEIRNARNKVSLEHYNSSSYCGGQIPEFDYYNNNVSNCIVGGAAVNNDGDDLYYQNSSSSGYGLSLDGIEDCCDHEDDE